MTSSGPRLGARGGVHGHDAAGRAVAGSIVEQVRDELAQPCGVGRHDQVVGRGHVVSDAPDGRRSGVDQVSEELPHAQVVDTQGCHAGVDARQVEEVVDEPAEAARLVEDSGQGVVVGRLDAVGEVLETSGQRGNGRAQLVRDGGDQRPALRVDVAQVGGHLVERAGQLADLVAGRGVDATRVVAARHPSRDLGHLPQRAGHPGREQLRHAQGDRHRHGHREPRGHSPGRAERADHGGDDDARRDEQAELDLDRGDPSERLAGHGDSRA